MRGFMNGIAGLPGAVTPGGAALMSMSPTQAMGEAGNLVRELMETERKYVAELEVLQVRRQPSLFVTTRVMSRRSSHLFFRRASFQSSVVRQLGRPASTHLKRHRPSHLLKHQQASRLPAKVPNYS